MTILWTEWAIKHIFNKKHHIKIYIFLRIFENFGEKFGELKFVA